MGANRLRSGMICACVVLTALSLVGCVATGGRDKLAPAAHAAVVTREKSPSPGVGEPTATPVATATGVVARPSLPGVETRTPTSTETPRPTTKPSSTPTPPPTSTPTTVPIPQLVASYPIEGDLRMLPDRPLVLEFDQSVSSSELVAHLSVTPTMTGAVEWISDRRLGYTPNGAWPSGPVTVTLTWRSSHAGEALGAPVSLHFRTDGRGAPIPVLMYHRIATLGDSATRGQRTWTVSPDAFAAQMRHLVETGRQAITPEQLADYLWEGDPLPCDPVMITMDDGYREVYTLVYPLLKDGPLRPVLFIPPSHVEYGAYLNWEQLAELSEAGFHVGVHGYDHSNLASASAETLAHQVGDSQDLLAAKLGSVPRAFCYPYGSHTDRIVAALREHGYRTGYTINPTLYQKPSDPYRIGRLLVSYDMEMEEFAALLIEPHVGY